MAVVNRKNKALTSMVILDTAQMEAGPIGIINLPFRLRTGTHGSWVPGSLLPRDADLCDMQHVSKELIRQFNPEAALYGFETLGNSMNDQ
jgi:carotenoid cleavage dioxygenase